MEWNKLAFMEWNKHPLITVSSQHIQHSIHCSSTRPPSHPNHSITNHQHLSKNEKPSPALQFTCLHLGIPLTPIKCNADKTQTHWNDLTISKQLPSQSKTLPHKECLHQKLHFQDKHKSYFPVSALDITHIFSTTNTDSTYPKILHTHDATSTTLPQALTAQMSCTFLT